ncbi:hypothetical protein COEX109129_36870 [Corallococcus exiguus]
MDEHHHVGVLLDGAGLTQVGEHGLAALALLHLTAELAERDDGHLQLLGQLLERAGDFSDFQLAALHLALLVHQLEVVDDEQRQARVLLLHAPRLRAQVERGQAAGVVDVDGRVVERARHLLELLLVVRGQPAAAQLLHVHARSGREQTHEQLIRGHFQAEDADGLVLLQRRVHRDVHGEGRLAHAGTRREDDELTGVQAGQLIVQVDVARGQTGHAGVRGLHLVQQVERLLHQLADRTQVAFALLLREEEDLALGLVEQDVQLARLLAGELLDLPAHVGQAPAQRLVLDDVGVLDGVGRQRDDLVQAHQVRGAAHRDELAQDLELLRERQVVHLLALLIQPHHRGEDLRVRRAGEVVRVDDLRHGRDEPVVRQHGAQHRTLRGEILVDPPTFPTVQDVLHGCLEPLQAASDTVQRTSSFLQQSCSNR